LVFSERLSDEKAIRPCAGRTYFLGQDGPKNEEKSGNLVKMEDQPGKNSLWTRRAKRGMEKFKNIVRGTGELKPAGGNKKRKKIELRILILKGCGSLTLEAGKKLFDFPGTRSKNIGF